MDSASQGQAEVGRSDGVSDLEKSRRAARGGSVGRGQNRLKTVENGSKGSKSTPDPPLHEHALGEWITTYKLTAEHCVETVKLYRILDTPLLYSLYFEAHT